MPAELVDLGETVIKGGNRVTSDGATVGIDEDDAVVAVIRVDLRAGPAGHGFVGDGHQAGVAVEDDDAAGAAGRASIADVGDRVVIDGRVGAAEIARADAAGTKQGPDLDAVLRRVPSVGADDGVVVDVGRQRRPIDEMPSFWKLLTVEFSISTVCAPLPPWAASWLVARMP